MRCERSMLGRLYRYRSAVLVGIALAAFGLIIGGYLGWINAINLTSGTVSEWPNTDTGRTVSPAFDLLRRHLGRLRSEPSKTSTQFLFPLDGARQAWAAQS